jgi:hypothetical protein
MAAYDCYRIPGFYSMYISSPKGIGVLIFAVLWLALGFYLLTKTEKLVRFVIVVVFILPFPWIFILAPAVFTIISAIGPIVFEPK